MTCTVQRAWSSAAFTSIALVAGGCRGASEVAAPSSPALELLARTVDHHDPEGRWDREPIGLTWTSTRADGSTSYVLEIVFGPDGDIAFTGERRGHAVEYRVQDGVAWARVDGSETVPEEVEAQVLVGRDEGLFWRDYLGFLAGLPMVLREPGVRIEPEPVAAELEGRTVVGVEARFAPEVGTDVWTLYLEPKTGATVGCRFDSADPEKPGETIVFEGEIVLDGVRLPRVRRWYVNGSLEFLGTDELAAR